MFQTKFIQKIKTHFISNVFFFFFNRTVYEITSKNTVQPGRPQMAIWRMLIACWIPKATDTHSENALLTDFPLQQWLSGSTSMLDFMVTPCISDIQHFIVRHNVKQNVELLKDF
jgi:hypothetical protein